MWFLSTQIKPGLVLKIISAFLIFCQWPIYMSTRVIKPSYLAALPCLSMKVAGA